MNFPNKFRTAEPVNLENIASQLSQPYSLEKTSDKQYVDIWIDTFDWRLWSNGLTLKLSKEELILSSHKPAKFLGKKEWKYKRLPNSEDTVFSGKWEKLAKMIRPRSLMNLATIQNQEEEYAILNEDRKKIARAIQKSVHVICNENTEYLGSELKIKALKGYESETEQICSNLELSLTQIPDDTDSFYLKALKKNQREPMDYSSKMQADLSDSINAGKALKKVIRSITSDLRRNETGIIEDIDTEFIHDARVSIRRIRVLLSQFSAILPQDLNVEPFKERFKYYSSLMGQVRDTDILLGKESSFADSLPENFQEGFSLLMQKTRRSRSRNLSILKKELLASDYASFMEEWKEFTESISNKNLKKKQQSLLAKELLFQKICKLSQQMNRMTLTLNEDVMHSMRLEVKKFRYVVEMCNVVLSNLSKQNKDVRKKLQFLQSSLGALNDSYVHEKYFTEIIYRIRMNEKSANEMKCAAACIVGIIHEKRTVLYELCMVQLKKLNETNFWDQVVDIYKVAIEAEK